MHGNSVCRCRAQSTCPECSGEWCCLRMTLGVLRSDQGSMRKRLLLTHLTDWVGGCQKSGGTPEAYTTDRPCPNHAAAGGARIRIQLWVAPKLRLWREMALLHLPSAPGQTHFPFCRKLGARPSAKNEAGTGKPLCFNLKIIMPLPKE